MEERNSINVSASLRWTFNVNVLLFRLSHRARFSRDAGSVAPKGPSRRSVRCAHEELDQFLRSIAAYLLSYSRSLIRSSVLTKHNIRSRNSEVNRKREREAEQLARDENLVENRKECRVEPRRYSRARRRYRGARQSRCLARSRRFQSRSG